jgi:hypothetical protein
MHNSLNNLGLLHMMPYIYLYWSSIICSDKLYKEIRDLNFEVVVQVGTIDFSSFLFHVKELVLTFL